MLTDPRIDNYKQTCYGCPEQYEGELFTGEFFYFRYRYGRAALYVSWYQIPYGPDSADGYAAADVGDDLQGIFESDEQRNGTFTKLLDDLDRMIQ